VRRRHDGGTEVVLERDDRGLIVAATNGQVSLKLERDAAGRVRRETQAAGGWQFVAEHEYDALGYRVATRYSTGWGVTRKRGTGGVLERLLVHAADGQVVESIDFEYGPREVARRSGRNDGTVTTRDKLGRPSKIQIVGVDGKTIRERSYEWAAAPGLLRIDDDRYGTRSYSLDVLGRPLSVSGLGVEDSFQYAPQGTPIARSDGPLARVGAVGRKLAGHGRTFRWDALGRLAQEVADSTSASWSYEYDADDQLVSATRGDGYRLRYLYDPFGRRVAILRDDGSSLWFGWDGDSPVEERGSGGELARFVYQDDGFTAIVDSPDGAAWRLVATDSARTPWLYLGAGGELSEIDLAPSGADARIVGTPSPLRFAGQRADSETGLRYNRHRYHSPRLGTFMTPDPLGLLGSVHDIGFVINATEFLDPLGLIIVLATYDDEAVASAKARAAATGQEIVHAGGDTSGQFPALGKDGLKGHQHVEVVTHGAPGSVIYDDGGEKRRSNGRQLGAKLRDNHGLEPGAEVVVIACLASTAPAKGGNRESIVQGVNAETGNPAVGPSGIAYVRPYKAATPGNEGSVDLNTGQWDRATGGNGQPTTVAPVAGPTAHAGSFNDPNATPGTDAPH
jgi:RHS repeat-associated protein